MHSLVLQAANSFQFFDCNADGKKNQTRRLHKGREIAVEPGATPTSAGSSNKKSFVSIKLNMCGLLKKRRGMGLMLCALLDPHDFFRAPFTVPHGLSFGLSCAA